MTQIYPIDYSKPEVIATFSPTMQSMVHSFSVTENYAVFFYYPLIIKSITACLIHKDKAAIDPIVAIKEIGSTLGSQHWDCDPYPYDVIDPPPPSKLPMLRHLLDKLLGHVWNELSGHLWD